MDIHKANEVARELASITAFRGARGNEESLLAWLDRQDEQGWAVAYASAYVPGQGSTIVWGMMTKDGTWEGQQQCGDTESWQGPDEGWCYGAKGLRPYGMEWGGKILEDAYPLTYRRQATARSGGEDYTELDQRLTLPEGLHWYPEYTFWGRWSGESGRVEPLAIEGTYADGDGNKARIVAVSKVAVEAQEGQGRRILIQFLDGTWGANIAFAGWTTEGEERIESKHLVYRRSAEHDKWAYIRGARRVQVGETEVGDDSSSKEGSDVEFICWPYLPDGDTTRETRKSRVTRDALRSYFDPIDDRCLEITPAFFHAEVLNKYLGDPERYEIDERQIRARGAWELKTYDINDEGQVHTYLVYLGQLPGKEQQHWQAHNEEPRGVIAERAHKMDIDGDFGPESLSHRLQRFAKDQTKRKSRWWKTHDLAAMERYLPCTNGDALNLWKESVGQLHKCTVENLVTKYFREGEAETTRKGEQGPLAALRGWLYRQKVDEKERKTVLEPLDELNHIRNTAIAHGRTPEAAEKEIAKAKGFPLRLRGHSLDLTTRVTKALLALEELVRRVEEPNEG